MRGPRFDKTWQRRRRWSRRWRLVRPWLVIAALAAIIAWYGDRPATPGDGVLTKTGFTICTERGSAACVIDGDTIAIGTPRQNRRIRLTGFDAPELDGACPAETEKARAARKATQAWLNAAPFFLSGGQQPPRDRYGRELRAAFRIDAEGRAEYLADVMIDRRLAADNGWSGNAIDWCG